jgi:hypothetical protein
MKVLRVGRIGLGCGVERGCIERVERMDRWR